MRLQGKIALITGSATGLTGEIRGIGGAAAWAFASPAIAATCPP